jgi:hypothetical protein
MNTFLLYLVGIILVAVPFALLPLLRALSANKACHLASVTAFFDLAPKLAADPRLPDKFAILIQMIAAKIDDGRCVPTLINGIMRDRKNGGRKSDDQITFNKAIDDLPEDIRKDLSSALAYGLLAMSYSSFLFGGLLRNVWFRPVGMPQRTVDAPLFAYRGLAHC